MTPLVGIVLVSHSAEIALGVQSLVGRPDCPEVVVATAGGTDDSRMGTGYSRILDALRTADAGAGVVVLPDLGGSVLSGPPSPGSGLPQSPARAAS